VSLYKEGLWSPQSAGGAHPQPRSRERVGTMRERRYFSSNCPKLMHLSRVPVKKKPNLVCAKVGEERSSVAYAGDVPGINTN